MVIPSMRPQTSTHHCHARGCRVAIPPHLFMCFAHWHMVPKSLRLAIAEAYRPGQEVDKRPSEAWLEAARAAIAIVAKQEGLEQ